MTDVHEDFSRLQQVKASSDRAFGGVFATVFLIIALWPLVAGGAPRWWSLVLSGLVLVATVALPSLLTIPNRLWLRFGLLLHRIVSPVALAVMYYLVVTPTGLLMRVFAKNILRLRRETGAESYWIKREPPGPQPDSMPRQF